MKWETSKAVITKFDDGHKLAIFHLQEPITNLTLGYIYPTDEEDLKDIERRLDAGECPVDEYWGNGQGRTCNEAGWWAG